MNEKQTSTISVSFISTKLLFIMLFVFFSTVNYSQGKSLSRGLGKSLLQGYQLALGSAIKEVETLPSAKLLRLAKSFSVSRRTEGCRTILKLLISREARHGEALLCKAIETGDEEGIRTLYRIFQLQGKKDFSFEEALKDGSCDNNSLITAVLASNPSSTTSSMLLSLRFVTHLRRFHPLSSRVVVQTAPNLIARETKAATYLSWEDIEKRLQFLSCEYPNILSLSSLGKTVQGRSIPLVKLSDNPLDDEDEPEILILAGMHPREQQPHVCAMEFLEEMVSAYGKDALLTRLINERQIWIVPLLNVDGKIHDFRRGTSPRLRANWRKNCFRNADRTLGVDINRNFPVRWLRTTLNGIGEDFPGTGPASEPETLAVMRFIASRPLRLFVDIHSYMGVHLVPRYLIEPDAKRYTKLLSEMTKRQAQPYPYRIPATGEVPPFQTHHGGAGLSYVWAFNTEGVYGVNIEVAGPGFYPSLREIHKEYISNIRGPLIYLLEACADLPRRKLGTAQLSKVATNRLPSPGALLTWHPTVTGPCSFGILVSKSPTVRVLAEYRLAPFTEGFTLRIMGNAKVGSKVPMTLYLWDKDRGRTVSDVEITISD